jgi:antitoxin (DNA-binding transcriptional repressor) of toxin-antitoxin stability system
VDVGVCELGQHLSRYIERAAGGQTIRVTDVAERGAPIARLGPPGHVSEEVAPWRDLER